MHGLFLFPVGGEAENARCSCVFFLIVETYPYVVLNGKIREKADILKRSCNAHFVDLNGVFAGGIHTVNDDGASCGRIYLGQQVKNCGFSGSVRTDKTCNFGLADGKVEVVNGAKTAEVDSEVDTFENRSFTDISFGNYRMARNGNHVAFFKVFHFAAPSFFFLPGIIFMNRFLTAGLLVASITRIRTMAYMSIL